MQISKEKTIEQDETDGNNTRDVPKFRLNALESLVQFVKVANVTLVGLLG